jgi:hypothetical protein
MISTSARRRSIFAAPVLAAFGTVRMTMDPSWLPLGALLYLWLERLLMPVLVPELDLAAYRAMALGGTLGLALVIVVKELGPACLAAWRAIEIEIRLTPLGGIVMAKRPLSLRDELLLALSGLSVGGLLGLALLIGWFKLSDAVTPLWLGGVSFFLGLATWGLAVAVLLPAWPLSGGRVVRAVVRALAGSPVWGGRVALGGTVLAVTAGGALGIYWAWTLTISGGALLLGAALLIGYLAWPSRPAR